MKKILLILLLLFFFRPVLQTAFTQQAMVSQWPKGITYEIFVQSFCDSDGDGKGDINGMTSKLNYLKNLGVSAVWLMPVNPSPSYHKYDVTDYYGIHPDYGTITDFKFFVTEAHKKNIKVVIDLVLNHCSKQHPWFKDAAKNEKSTYRDYFVWGHKDDTRVKNHTNSINEDSRNRNRWNKVEGSDYLYYSYFGGHMPDLNFDSPELRREILKIGRYWLTEIGIDGFRLDAARHIFPEERVNENYSWWEYFLAEMQKVKKDVYLVGEVWASAKEVAPYLKGIPALFNFDLATAIKKAVNEGNADSLVLKLKVTKDFYVTVNPGYTDATFLSNHDQNRVMSALGDDLNKAKIAAALLLTLPGSPYLYYGEEIGMRGKKPDEFIREPFLWDTKSKDKGRTRWVVPKFNMDSTIAPVMQQLKNDSSLLNYYKKFISFRNGSVALTLGDLSAVDTGVKELCTFKRTYRNENLLVLLNLSENAVTFTLPEYLEGYKKIRFKTNAGRINGNTFRLAAFSTLILQK